jgi:asparagine synthase (glutamine-hydrolysing)
MYLESDLRRIYPSAHQHPNAVFQWLKHAIAPGEPGFGLPFLSKVSWAEMHTYMGHTLLRDADQMSMAHALEVRVPFLDYRLVTQVAAMQDAVKWTAGRQKPLLVDALGDLLPRELVERPKMGFVLPWDQWMRESLRPVCEAGIAGLKRIPGLHHAEVEGLWQRFLRGDAGVNHARLWMWVVLGDWMDRHGIE